jgi:PhnB protein
MPYLHFNGNCEEAFNFYAKCFGAKTVDISRLNNDPKNPVMHATVMLTENGGISGNDHRHEKDITGIQILVLLPSRERVEEIIAMLSEGGRLISGFKQFNPPDDNGGGAEVLDKYGYTWFLCA